MPSRLSWFLQSLNVTALSGTAFFFVYTKHTAFSKDAPLNSTDANVAKTDKLYSSPWMSKLNPKQYAALTDDCERRVPLWKLRRELWDQEYRDALQAKSSSQSKPRTLVEAFAGGVWGSFGYAIQRHVLGSKYGTSHPDDLWSQHQLTSSSYEPDTKVTNHFQVLSKTPTSIVFRAGDSPDNSPNAPRESDGLFEIIAITDLDHGFAEFHLKSVFFNGATGDAVHKPLMEMNGALAWLHRQYSKLLLESAVSSLYTKSAAQ